MLEIIADPITAEQCTAIIARTSISMFGEEAKIRDFNRYCRFR
jgi:hypothetical protein